MRNHFSRDRKTKHGKINWSEKGTTKTRNRENWDFDGKEKIEKESTRTNTKKENIFFWSKAQKHWENTKTKKGSLRVRKRWKKRENKRRQKRESRWKEDEHKEGIKRKRSHFRRTTWKTDERKTEKKMRPKKIKHEVFPIMFFSKKKKKRRVPRMWKDDFSYLIFFSSFLRREKQEERENTKEHFSLKGPTRKEHSFC